MTDNVLNAATEWITTITKTSPGALYNESITFAMDRANKAEDFYNLAVSCEQSGDIPGATNALMTCGQQHLEASDYFIRASSYNTLARTEYLEAAKEQQAKAQQAFELVHALNGTPAESVTDAGVTGTTVAESDTYPVETINNPVSRGQVPGLADMYKAVAGVAEIGEDGVEVWNFGIAKGDVPGHEFHGNQYSSATEGAKDLAEKARQIYDGNQIDKFDRNSPASAAKKIADEHSAQSLAHYNEGIRIQNDDETHLNAEILHADASDEHANASEAWNKVADMLGNPSQDPDELDGAIESAKEASGTATDASDSVVPEAVNADRQAGIQTEQSESQATPQMKLSTVPGSNGRYGAFTQSTWDGYYAGHVNVDPSKLASKDIEGANLAEKAANLDKDSKSGGGHGDYLPDVEHTNLANDHHDAARALMAVVAQHERSGGNGYMAYAYRQAADLHEAAAHAHEVAAMAANKAIESNIGNQEGRVSDGKADKDHDAWMKASADAATASAAAEAETPTDGKRTMYPDLLYREPDDDSYPV